MKINLFISLTSSKHVSKQTLSFDTYTKNLRKLTLKYLFIPLYDTLYFLFWQTF